jgi:hypothetical protein
MLVPRPQETIVSLTEAVPTHVRAESTFIFVTPLSGHRGWPSDWRDENQLVWIDARQRRN